MTEIVWISLNPESCKIEIYPMEAALKIEESYWTFQRNCELGKNFNNSIVHFNFGIIYQITPITRKIKTDNLQNDDLINHEENNDQEYKSVERCVVINKQISVNVKKTGEEWRITQNESDKLKTLYKFIETKDIIEVKTKGIKK